MCLCIVVCVCAYGVKKLRMESNGVLLSHAMACAGTILCSDWRNLFS